MTSQRLSRYISTCYAVINFQISSKIGYCSMFSMLLRTNQSNQFEAFRNPFHQKKYGYIKDETVNLMVKSNI